MLTFEFTLEDLARTRFAISPMWELIAGLRALRDSEWAAMHLPWVREALPIAHELDMGTALAATPTTGYIPDFLTPPPSGPLAEFSDELALVEATPARQVRRDLEIMFRGRRVPPELGALIDHPRRELRRLVRVLDEFWRRAV